MKVDIKDVDVAVKDMLPGQVFIDRNEYWMVTDRNDGGTFIVCVNVETGVLFQYAQAAQFPIVDVKMVLTS